MKGIIRPKGKCSVCQGTFVEIKKLGFICPEHKIVPKRFLIDMFYKGQRIRLFSDKQGQPLDTYQRALNILAHINYEIQNHIFDPTKYLRQELEKFYVSNLINTFLAFKIESLAPSYQGNYKRYVQITKEYFKIKDVREIKKLDIINYQEYLTKNYNYKGKTLKNILDFFKTFLRYLKNDIEILDNIPAFPTIETKPPQIKWLSPEVQQRIYENTPDEDKPIMAFMMLSGCRPGEARALKCRDVNLTTGLLAISATFSCNIYREKRKGRNARNAIIPIHPEIFGYIKSRVENNLPEAFLFINRAGKCYSRSSLDRLWNNIRERIELDNKIRLYDATRHSFASQLVNKGVSILSVSRLLGHSSVKMTEKYAHSDVERLKIDITNLSLKEEIIQLKENRKVDSV